MKPVSIVFIVLLCIFALLTLSFGFNQMMANPTEEISWFIFVVVAMAIFGSSILILAVIGTYKKKLRGEIYPIDKYTTLELTAESDIYSHSHTTSYRYKSSKKK